MYTRAMTTTTEPTRTTSPQRRRPYTRSAAVSRARQARPARGSASVRGRDADRRPPSSASASRPPTPPSRPPRASAARRTRPSTTTARRCVAPARVLDLVAGALPERASARCVERSARPAARCRRARDHAVAPDDLALLPLGDADERMTADAIIADAAARRAAARDLKTTVADGRRAAAHRSTALEAALPPALDDSAFVEGVAATYAARAAPASTPRSTRRSTRGAAAARSSRTSSRWSRPPAATSRARSPIRSTSVDRARRRRGLDPPPDLIRAHIDGDGNARGRCRAARAGRRPLGELADREPQEGQALFDRAGKRFATKVRRALAKAAQPPRRPTPTIPTT